ncbi:hypothetical protein [Spirosoma harenae]
MKRAEKVSLLTKVLQGGINQTNRQRLQQVWENTLRSLIIIDDLDFESGQSIADDDPVHFYYKGKKHQMTLWEACQFACRYSVGTIFILPAKRANC